MFRNIFMALFCLRDLKRLVAIGSIQNADVNALRCWRAAAGRLPDDFQTAADA
ncbi:hypothetical protein [Pikeienuella sp. HZG-20]|uniref:hypothetical protein n=1 Tax=Paludibacillus litoralis TaxID=3133267 RepID=UPI0030EEAF0E